LNRNFRRKKKKKTRRIEPVEEQRPIKDYNRGVSTPLVEDI
jgi:hypothetical protein